MTAQLAFPSMALTPVSRAKRIRHAQIAADRGIERAADRADRETPGWVDGAIKRVGQFAAGQHGMFTMETCRWVLEQDQTFERPRELRSWGAVTRGALKAKFIEKTNQASPAYSSNGSLKPMYRRGAGA